jgi:UDP-N-acetylmuramyl pentapeptide phosphotransferase/UDP-N-acetylglucosamine-1-phosphate transferase
MADPTLAEWLAFAAVILAAFLLSLALNAALRPWFVRYALARPNARSSHVEPTPQGGGMAVVAATLLVAWSAALFFPAALQHQFVAFLTLTAAALLLTVVGAVDDIRVLPALPRLVLQCLAAAAVLVALPADFHIVPQVPQWLERAGLFVGLVWMVNLVNFMDGIDWMTVAEAVPIAAAVAIFGLSGIVPPLVALVALALFGAMLGFAPFNRPVARLFLGDVGSLPIGLMLGWLLLLLAISGHLAAALLLPLYYLADASITLLLRVLRRETVWKAHRSHFYQRAVAGGLTVPAVVAWVFATNIALAALAAVSVVAGTTIVSVLCLTGGSVLVGLLLAHFAKARG